MLSRRLLFSLVLAVLLLLAGWPSAARAYCVNPAGVKGDIIFSNAWRVEQYCNDFQWVPMGRPLYTPQGVTFDGSTTYLGSIVSGGLGGADGSSMTGSLWFRRSGNYGVTQAIFTTGTSPANARFAIFFYTDNKIYLQGGATSSNDLLVMHASTAITDSNWHHLMFSFDLTNNSATGRYMYLDGVAQTLAVSTYNNGNIVFSGNYNSVGSTIATVNKFQGDLADLWLDENFFLDLSQAANRAYFIDSTGNAVYLGPAGANTPDGAGEEVYLTGPVSAWQTNKCNNCVGFTLNGTLTDADPITTGDITTGLIHWWKLDESSGTTAGDSAGSASATLTGTAAFTTSGKDAGALSLPNDGTVKDASVTTPSDMLGKSALTVSMWFKRAGAGSKVQIGQQPLASGLNTIGMEAYSDGLLYFEIGTTSANAEGNISSNDTNWHLATLVFDGSQTGDANRLKAYLDGAQQTLTFDTPGIPAATTPNALTFYLGAIEGAANDTDAGTLDDVRIYNRALSATDVRKLYNLGYYTCTNPSDHRGDLVYSGSSNHVLQYCDGATWRAAGKNPGTGGAGCSNPAGSEGHIIYNGDYSVMQYCDGAVWRQIGGRPPTPSASGLIHEWKLDEAPGATTAVDSVNAINMTTKTGTVDFTTSGKDNNGLSFPDDGTVKAFSRTIPADMRNISAITVSMWFKLANASTSYITFGSQDSNTNIGPEVYGSGTGEPNLIFFNLDNSGHSSMNAPWSPDTNWHHLVEVFDGTQATQANRLKGYLDGVQLTLTAYSGTIPTTTGNTAATFYFGEISGGEISAGSMDDVRVYNRALSAQEVRNLYNGT